MEKEMDNMKEESLGWRVIFSIISGIAWLVFLIIWLFYYASEYSIYENIGIFILSIFVVALILGIPWMTWGMRYRSEEEKEIWQAKGFQLRMYSSAILALMFIMFLIVWFFFFASDYSIYQNIAVLIVSVLVIGGVLGALWAPWALKQK